MIATTESRAQVDALIVETILPQAYGLIDELLTAGGSPGKDLVLRCRKLLPATYTNSISFRKATT